MRKGFWRAIGAAVLAVALALGVSPAIPAASSSGEEVVARFAEMMLKANDSGVMALIHPEFSAEDVDREAFQAWLLKWFQWDDDYIFRAPELQAETQEELVLVRGAFHREWLMGIAGDDVDLEADPELTESLTEEGQSVQSVKSDEDITFTLKPDGGSLKIVGIEGMSLYDPEAAARSARDPHSRRIGEALSALTRIPLIGGLFSHDKAEFQKGVRGLALVLGVLALAFIVWVGGGALKNQLQLAVLNSHTFPEGVSYHTQYSGYVAHREAREAGGTERRHDFYLRNMIDEGKFEEARKYARGMVVFCRQQGDNDAGRTYEGYLEKVGEIHGKAKAGEFVPARRAEAPARAHREEFDVHRLLHPVDQDLPTDDSEKSGSDAEAG